jgi:two-component system, LytTR family, response regulator
MLNCVIIDDESAAIDVLTFHISNTPNLNLLFSNTDSIVGYNYVTANSEQIDILFLDIKMPKMTGIELKRLIPGNIKTVFTTAYSEHALEAFDLDASDYLMKPISYDKFIKSVKKISQNYISQKRDHFFIHVDKKHIKINIADVVHVEGYGNFLKIYCKLKPFYLSSNTFQEIEKYLVEPNFVRINKSHIIAFNSIQSVEGNSVRILIEKSDKNQEIEIPIGITYRKHFLEMMNRI